MAVGSVVGIASLIIALTPAANLAAGALAVPPDLTKADAIVVLGGGLLRDGTPTFASMSRMLFGMRLYQTGLAPMLIFCGPPRENTSAEATVRARLATELGLSSTNIHQITDALTTREEAEHVAGFLSKRKLNHVLLVTEPMHMRRSKLVFEAAGLNVSPAPSDNFPAIARSPLDRLLLFHQLVMHSVGLAYYKVAGFI